MTRLAAPSLTNRPLRSTPSASSSLAAQSLVKRPAAQSPFRADQFEQSPARAQGSQFLSQVDKRQPQAGIRYDPRAADSNLERSLAQVQYKKLKEQGPPQRLDYPLTSVGQKAYEKATEAYNDKLFDLQVKAGYVVF